MTTFPSSAARISARVLSRFPASVSADAGISVSASGGAYEFALDYPALEAASTIDDPSVTYIALYNSETGEYSRIRPDQIILPEAGARTPRGDADYVILNTDRYVGLTASLTADRTFTLPAASGVTGGTVILVQDEAGGVDATNTLIVAAAGADLINGATTYVVSVPFGGAAFVSDGSAAWSTAVLAIGADAVATANIQSLAVTTGKIAANAATNAKLAQMAEGTVKARLSAGTGDPEDATLASLATAILPELGLGDLATKDAVAEGDIGSGAVTADKIGAGAVSEAKIGTGAVTTVKIADGAVTYPKMALGPGAVVASASTALTAHGGPYSTTIPLDDTIPQNTEGTQIQTLAFALTNSGNKVKFCWTGHFAATATTNTTVAIFVDSAASAAASAVITCTTSGHIYCLTVEGEHSPGDTSTHTYKVRIGGTAGNLYINGNSTGRLLGGSMGCVFTCTEIEV